MDNGSSTSYGVVFNHRLLLLVGLHSYLNLTLLTVYRWWVEHCYSHNGFYPYPLFAVLDTTQRVFLFVGAAMTMTASTMMLKWLYGRVNGLKGAQTRAKPGNVKAQ